MSRGHYEKTADRNGNMTIVLFSLYVLGPFHSTKTSGLNFRQLPVAIGTAFSKISKKRTTSRGIHFSRKVSFHSTLFPKVLEFSVEWFEFQKFKSFRNFWKLFWETSVPFAAVSKFQKVLVEWKAIALCFPNAGQVIMHQRTVSFKFRLIHVRMYEKTKGDDLNKICNSDDSELKQR